MPRESILYDSIYKVQNQTKLISAVTSQDAGYPQGRWGLTGEREEFWVAGHALSLDPGLVTQVCSVGENASGYILMTCIS